jgi:RNA polymerase sigma-70 factor (ECF subfamily)
MVQLRLDHRLAGRLDPSDVVQEAYLDASRRVADYVRHPRVPLYVWLRGLLWDRLLMSERRHLGAKCRSVRRELPADDSVMLGQRLLADQTSPSQRMMIDELRRRVQDGLDRLDPMDREVLLMRHFEEMTNGEVAQALGLSDSAASMRYGRALFRLKHVLISGSLGEDASS